MTFEKIESNLIYGQMTTKDAANEIRKPDKMKRINWYAHLYDASSGTLTDPQLQELSAIVNVLQMIYTAGVDTGIADSKYDVLQEMLVNMGVPRLTGSVEINDHKKVSHTYKTLRGTLDKVYYLSENEKRTNKSRKYLDEWIRSAEARFLKKTGKPIDLNDEKVLITPKFDGCSAILEWDGKQAVWISRGDTSKNRASDISHIMKVFNDLYCNDDPKGVKFEVMCPEENLERINQLQPSSKYSDSRQVVSATINATDVDYKVDYLRPVPLRIIRPGDEVEEIHPDLIRDYPSIICRLGDRDQIRQFANEHRTIQINGVRMRTDGAVMTILNPMVQRVLGRENDVNKFEVAYKFTEEVAYAKVKDVEFYVSEFGIITPVLVIYPVKMKGKTIDHITLSNKDRFMEMDLCYGDTVAVHYDIIPYVTADDRCKRMPGGRKIEFISNCPKCHEELDLEMSPVVYCTNPICPSRVVGRVLNYCTNVRIQQIGWNTLDTLYTVGLLNNGIRSLYKLRKHRSEIEDLPGFGHLKTRKILAEIEAKRKLRDFEFFGAIGIKGLSTKSFQMIFQQIPYQEFLDLIRVKNWDLLAARLIRINKIGPEKAELLVTFFKEPKNQDDLKKLLKELTIFPSYGLKSMKGRVVFTGCRPSEETREYLTDKGYEVSDSWSNKTQYLVVPNDSYESSKVVKAKALDIPIIPMDSIKEVLK